MKIYNKSNSMLIIKGVAVNPKSFAIFDEDVKNNPDFISFLEKKYIEIVTPKNEKKFKVQESPKVKYTIEERKTVKDNNKPQYIVSTPINPEEYEVKDDVVVSKNIGESDVVEMEGMPTDNIPEEVFATPSDMFDDIKIVDADEEIMRHAEETAKIIQPNGKFGAKEVSVQKAIKEDLKKVAQELKDGITPTEVLGSKRLKEFSSKPEHKQRVEISKMTDKDFLHEISSFSKNSTIKKLAQQRLKELE
jgi:hypothetical protein